MTGADGFDDRWLALLIPGFVAAFVVFWTFVVAVIARMGWSRLADRFATHVLPAPGAQRLGGQSLSVGTGLLAPNYKNCITAWIDRDALFLRPMILFRMFHPMLQFRWSEVRSVDEMPRMILRRVRLTPQGDVPAVMLTGRLAVAVHDMWQGRAPKIDKGLP